MKIKNYYITDIFISTAPPHCYIDKRLKNLLFSCSKRDPPPLPFKVISSAYQAAFEFLFSLSICYLMTHILIFTDFWYLKTHSSKFLLSFYKESGGYETKPQRVWPLLSRDFFSYAMQYGNICSQYLNVVKYRDLRVPDFC